MDRHLNCFYTYNQSNELIEDNLTRALIVTLSWLSNTTRNSLLHKLKGVFPAFDFSTAKFSLHEIEFSPKIFRNQYIMTISTDLEYHLEKPKVEGEIKVALGWKAILCRQTLISK